MKDWNRRWREDFGDLHIGENGLTRAASTVNPIYISDYESGDLFVSDLTKFRDLDINETLQAGDIYQALPDGWKTVEAMFYGMKVQPGMRRHCRRIEVPS